MTGGEKLQKAIDVREETELLEQRKETSLRVEQSEYQAELFGMQFGRAIQNLEKEEHVYAEEKTAVLYGDDILYNDADYTVIQKKINEREALFTGRQQVLQAAKRQTLHTLDAKQKERIVTMEQYIAGQRNALFIMKQDLLQSKREEMGNEIEESFLREIEEIEQKAIAAKDNVDKNIRRKGKRKKMYAQIDEGLEKTRENIEITWSIGGEKYEIFKKDRELSVIQEFTSNDYVYIQTLQKITTWEGMKNISGEKYQQEKKQIEEEYNIKIQALQDPPDEELQKLYRERDATAFQLRTKALKQLDQEYSDTIQEKKTLLSGTEIAYKKAQRRKIAAQEEYKGLVQETWETIETKDISKNLQRMSEEGTLEAVLYSQQSVDDIYRAYETLGDVIPLAFVRKKAIEERATIASSPEWQEVRQRFIDQGGSPTEADEALLRFVEIEVLMYYVEKDGSLSIAMPNSLAKSLDTFAGLYDKLKKVLFQKKTMVQANETKNFSTTSSLEQQLFRQMKQGLPVEVMNFLQQPRGINITDEPMMLYLDEEQRAQVYMTLYTLIHGDIPARMEMVTPDMLMELIDQRKGKYIASLSPLMNRLCLGGSVRGVQNLFSATMHNKNSLYQSIDFSFDDIGLAQNSFSYQGRSLSYNFDDTGNMCISGSSIGKKQLSLPGCTPDMLVKKIEKNPVDIMTMVSLGSRDAIQSHMHQQYMHIINDQLTILQSDKEQQEQLHRDLEYHACLAHLEHLDTSPKHSGAIYTTTDTVQQQEGIASLLYVGDGEQLPKACFEQLNILLSSSEFISSMGMFEGSVWDFFTDCGLLNITNMPNASSFLDIVYALQNLFLSSTNETEEERRKQFTGLLDAHQQSVMENSYIRSHATIEKIG